MLTISLKFATLKVSLPDHKLNESYSLPDHKFNLLLKILYGTEF